MALDLLVAQIRSVRKTGRMPARELLEHKPAFMDRGSLGPAPAKIPSKRTKESAGENLAPVVATPAARWAADPLARREQVASLNQNPYPAAREARDRKWVQLDMRRVFNRQFEHEHGWVNELPLLHMPSGRQTIHGVPFQIASGVTSKEPDCLVLRSEHAHTGMGKKLPDTVSLPLGGKVEKVYFLHGCGYAMEPVEFASYEFHYEDGETVRLPLTPVDRLEFKTRNSPANIEDCWPYGSKSLPSSRRWQRYVVTDNGDPSTYERHLYTLEWTNPDPQRRVKRIVARSHPSASATLGVIAVTALVAED
jgi:hypothetical protein